MDYLLNLGFDEEFIIELKSLYNESNQVLISINEDYVVNAVKYLREIGITEENIKELFINNIDFLFKDLDEIKEIFGKYDIKKIVELLNEDISIINRIY